MMQEPLCLEVFSDFNCPWCYFQSGEIKRLKQAYDIDIIWRAFPLHPDAPDEGLPIETLFGDNIEMMREKMRQLEQKATDIGLPLKERSVISNSRLSQELAKWAATENREDEYHEAVYKAYFADGYNIAEISVLLDAVEAARLSREEAQMVIEKRTYADAVDADWELSETLGIMVAPSYVVNQDRLLGPQPYEKLRRLIESNSL